MSLVIDLIDLVAKHKSGELHVRCSATALIFYLFGHSEYLIMAKVHLKLASNPP